jgi:hypothetical protein
MDGIQYDKELNKTLQSLRLKVDIKINIWLSLFGYNFFNLCTNLPPLSMMVQLLRSTPSTLSELLPYVLFEELAKPFWSPCF